MLHLVSHSRGPTIVGNHTTIRGLGPEQEEQEESSYASELVNRVRAVAVAWGEPKGGTGGRGGRGLSRRVERRPDVELGAQGDGRVSLGILVSITRYNNSCISSCYVERYRGAGMRKELT